MSLPAGIVLGILIGWLVEWVIDWIYWRPKRKLAVQSPLESRAALLPLEESTAGLDALRSENAHLKSQLEKFTYVPYNLKVIKGIGLEIERRLHQAGILSFAQLAVLTPADLERILGDSISATPQWRHIPINIKSLQWRLDGFPVGWTDRQPAWQLI